MTAVLKVAIKIAMRGDEGKKKKKAMRRNLPSNQSCE